MNPNPICEALSARCSAIPVAAMTIPSSRNTTAVPPAPDHRRITRRAIAGTCARGIRSTTGASPAASSSHSAGLDTHAHPGG